MAIWHWLKASCDVAWRRHARFLLTCWFLGALVCLYAGWAGEGLHYYLDYMWNGTPNSGIMTLVSGFCLVACGWGLLVAARRAMRTPGGARETWGWVLAGLGCVWLAFDEVIQLHERAARLMERFGVPPLFGVLDLDFYLFAAYLAGLLLVFALLWPTRRPLEPVMLPLAVAITCFAISEVLDQLPWRSMSHATQQIVGAFEEGYKVFGSWTLAMCGLLVADEATREQ